MNPALVPRGFASACVSLISVSGSRLAVSAQLAHPATTVDPESHCSDPSTMPSPHTDWQVPVHELLAHSALAAQVCPGERRQALDGVHVLVPLHVTGVMTQAPAPSHVDVVRVVSVQVVAPQLVPDAMFEN